MSRPGLLKGNTAAKQKGRRRATLFNSHYASYAAGSAGRRGKQRHRAAVLRPAGDVVADRDRPFLAVGDRLHALGRNAACREIFARGGGAAGAERDVVFARAAFVGMAFDRDRVIGVLLQPRRLLVAASGGRVGQMAEESVSKKMRSPTLTVKSCCEPGVGAVRGPDRPRCSAACSLRNRPMPAPRPA